MFRREFLKVVSATIIVPLSEFTFRNISVDKYQISLQKAIKKLPNTYWKSSYLKKGEKPTTFNPHFEYGACVRISKPFEKHDIKEQKLIFEVLAQNIYYTVPPEYRKNVEFVSSADSEWKSHYKNPTVGWIYRRTG